MANLNDIRDHSKVIVDWSLEPQKLRWKKVGILYTYDKGDGTEDLVGYVKDEVKKYGAQTVKLGKTWSEEADIYHGPDKGVASYEAERLALVKNSDILVMIPGENLVYHDPCSEAEKQQDVFWNWIVSSGHALLTEHPSERLAKNAGMDQNAYADIFYKGVLQDWQAEETRYETIIKKLRGFRSLHVTGPGTDITLDISGRWSADAGRFTYKDETDYVANLPGGEIWTTPFKTGVNGTMTFDFPYWGKEKISGVKLRFVDGKAVEATAQEGQSYLDELLHRDVGASTPGEFAFGMNSGITVSLPTWEEKIADTVHLGMGYALPSSFYPQQKSKVNVSDEHFDMPTSMKNGTVEGTNKNGETQTIYKNGEFVI